MQLFNHTVCHDGVQLHSRTLRNCHWVLQPYKLSHIHIYLFTYYTPGLNHISTHSQYQIIFSLLTQCKVYTVSLYHSVPLFVLYNLLDVTFFCFLILSAALYCSCIAWPVLVCQLNFRSCFYLYPDNITL